MTNSIADIAQDSECVFIIGSNTTEQHPVIGARVRAAKRRRGAKLIVADPRRIDIADYADLHLRHRPGTDIALLNGLMHVILREGWQDEEFIGERTEGLEEFKAVVEKYTPESVSEITAAVIIADKADVHRSRVQNPDTLSFDIHDRVNYAAQRSFVRVDAENRTITLELEVDTEISSVMEYFEIFMSRMLMTRRAVRFLGCEFVLTINETKMF